MKKIYPWLFMSFLVTTACTEDKYILDSYSTMRYDALKLPTAADTLALYTVDFVSTTQGFVGGAKGTVFGTTDAGRTWTRLTAPSSGAVNKLLFTSATTGWAGTGTGLYRTTNGGSSWQYVPTPDGYGYGIGVQDLQFVTPQVGYAVGTGGGICKTTNGGSSWTSVQNRTYKRYTFRAVSFSSPDSGTVVGNEQSRWLTTNGGQTWEIFDYYSGHSNDYYAYDVLRFNTATYQLATPAGFRAYDVQETYGRRPDEEFSFPVYGLASAGPRGPVVAVGERTVVRQHAAYSLSPHTPWVNVHAADGTSFVDTFFAADFADAATFYAVGPRGLIYRFYYQ